MAASPCCNAALYFSILYTQVRATRGIAHAHKKCFAKPIEFEYNIIKINEPFISWEVEFVMI